MIFRSLIVIVVLMLFGLVDTPNAEEPNAKSLYLLRCSGCHQASGKGSIAAGVPAFPNLVDAFARDREGRNYIAHVPGIVGSGLNNEETAIVLNYILTKWAGSPDSWEPFTTEELSTLRATPVNDIVSYRRAIVKRFTEEGVAVASYPWP